MNQKTLLKLEYDKIINLLADQASSDSGKRRCRSLLPMTDLEEINIAEETYCRRIYTNCEKRTAFF